MVQRNNANFELDEFTPPGIVKVSAAALKLARDFGESVKRMRPNQDWVASFDWALARSFRVSPDAPWQNVGPGLDLGAYERHKIPPGFIQTTDGVEFAIKIPREVWESSRHRLIDTDETAFSKLALR